MSRRRAALATVAGSSFSTAIAALQAIVLLPSYISAAGETMYGAWLAVGEVLLLLLAMDLGLPHLLIQRIGSQVGQRNEEQAGEYFATGLVVLSSIAIALYALVGICALSLTRTLLGEQEAHSLAQTMRIACAATSLSIVNYAFVGLSRALQETLLVNIFNSVATVLGFVTTYFLLKNGSGLDAIAWGMVVRASIGLIGGVIFVLSCDTVRPLVRCFKVSRAAFRDYLEHSPSLMLSGAAYALMTNSHVTVVAFLLSPQMAVMYSVTRKVAELVKSLLDMIAYSSVAGFAHAWSSLSPDRAKKIHEEIVATFFAVAGGGVAAYIAVNSAFVSLWVGDAYFGGLILTALIAVSIVVSSWSNLELSLLRSTGEIKQASYAIALESGSRLAAMLVLTSLFGLVGVPIAVATTALASVIWARARLNSSTAGPLIGLRTMPFLIGTSLSLVLRPASWLEAIIVSIVAGSMGLLVLVFCDRSLFRYSRKLKWRRV